jgi:3-oxoacyl-[acyl-carrier-protein] synthase II
MHRVVVTGVGLVTPLGVGTDETWQALIAGRSAVGPIESFDASSLRTQLAAELDGFDPEQFATRKALRSMTRNDQLAVAGAAVAVQDAELETPEVGDDARARRGLFIGSNKEVSNLPPILEGALVSQTADGTVDVGLLGANATSALPPLYYIEGLQAASLFYISQAYGLMGANTYYAGTADAGATAVGSAFRAIRRGEVDAAITGGFDDATSWWNMTKFDTMGLLTDENELGSQACRPYDVDRSGAVLGEGSAFLVLEDAEHAASRGAKAYAEITGFGSAYDAFGLLTPDPSGRPVATAIRSALRDAGSATTEVDYVVTHGCGTRAGDASEARALRDVFGDGSAPAASSIKPATGHLVGGAGALNAAVAVLALHHRALPPTLNLETPDPACEGIDWVTGESRPAQPGLALALARGLEGQNVALVVRATL